MFPLKMVDLSIVFGMFTRPGKAYISPFTMILVMVDSTVSMIRKTVPAAVPQDTHASFEHVPTNAPQGAIMLQPEAGLLNGKSPERI